MEFHKDGTPPPEGYIFVFGSNDAGVHGAGAARLAYTNYGAVRGIGRGMRGESYGIATKDYEIQTKPIPLIELDVEIFKDFTLSNPTMKFFITRVGCGLAGYKDHQIAPLFKGCSDNCSFPESWKPYV